MPRTVPLSGSFPILLPTLALCLSLLAGVSLLAGCGAGDATTPTTASDSSLSTGPGTGTSTGPSTSPGSDAEVRPVDEDQARLHLWVSNQSFIDDPVRITVSIDGVTLVEQDFDVEGQHNWEFFGVALPPGEHRIRVSTGTGATITRTFRTGPREPRYAVVNYWNYDDADGRFLDWIIQDDPVAFA